MAPVSGKLRRLFSVTQTPVCKNVASFVKKSSEKPRILDPDCGSFLNKPYGDQFALVPYRCNAWGRKRTGQNARRSAAMPQAFIYFLVPPDQVKVTPCKSCKLLGFSNRRLARRLDI